MPAREAISPRPERRAVSAAPARPGRRARNGLRFPKIRGRRKRVRAFLLTTVAAAVAIAGGAELLLGQVGRGSADADPLAVKISQIQTSESGTLLEQARQHIILMTAATKSFKVVGSPTLSKTPPSASGSAPTVYAPPPDPGTAQALGYQLLPTFGFDASTQYGCLNNIFMRESGWRYNAANASGAYGIPQALPGSKMVAFGADWQTNPATQIKWGISYMKGRYGSPCDAWAFWQAHGWY